VPNQQIVVTYTQRVRSVVLLIAQQQSHT